MKTNMATYRTQMVAGSWIADGVAVKLRYEFPCFS